MELNATIAEIAAQLGNLIKDTPEMQRMKKAEEAMRAHVDLQGKLQEYGVHTRTLADNPDAAFAASITDRVKMLADEIEADPVYIEFQAAQNDVGELMNLVNNEINYAITGERSCSGNCSSCGGCG